MTIRCSSRSLTQRMGVFILLFLTINSASPLSTSAQESVKTEWQVMMLDQQRIGYASLETRQEGQILKLKQSSRMEFQRFGQKIELETELQTEELIDGTLRSFRFEIRNPPNKPTI
ncbi:hypothetical protein OAK47_03920, partial [Planctomycetaceae bacterium]|nr:hypothetical protein [Planctomycetaceae bacterium]